MGVLTTTGKLKLTSAGLVWLLSNMEFDTEEEAQDFCFDKRDGRIVKIDKEVENKKFDFDKIYKMQREILKE